MEEQYWEEKNLDPLTARSKSKRKTHVGPWRLGRTLGRGASGRVRLAKHAITGQLAAVKILTKSASSHSIYEHRPDAVQGENQSRLPIGLEREVVIMKLIEHPNIIGLYDVWENKYELYLVVEYVEGGELFEYLARKGRLPEEEAISFFRQIISGIDYCHRFNICHRDLKPENILLDKHNNVKIADFGMAAMQPTGSLLHTSCGSPHYAAPEIISGNPYNGASADIWSAGIILFALLTGYLPFDDDNLRRLLAKVKTGHFTMPEGLSTDAKGLLWHILEVEPSKRITLNQIWEHPLVKKYATSREVFNEVWRPTPAEIDRPLRFKGEIDKEVLKNLRILWNGECEEVILDRLLNNSSNQEKLFYCLLLRYRARHIESYLGGAGSYAFAISNQERYSNVQRRERTNYRHNHKAFVVDDSKFTGNVINPAKAPNDEIKGLSITKHSKTRRVCVSKFHQPIHKTSSASIAIGASALNRGVRASCSSRRNVTFRRIKSRTSPSKAVHPTALMNTGKQYSLPNCKHPHKAMDTEIKGTCDIQKDSLRASQDLARLCEQVFNSTNQKPACDGLYLNAKFSHKRALSTECLKPLPNLPPEALIRTLNPSASGANGVAVVPIDDIGYLDEVLAHLNNLVKGDCKTDSSSEPDSILSARNIVSMEERMRPGVNTGSHLESRLEIENREGTASSEVLMSKRKEGSSALERSDGFEKQYGEILDQKTNPQRSVYSQAGKSKKSILGIFKWGDSDALKERWTRDATLSEHDINTNSDTAPRSEKNSKSWKVSYRRARAKSRAKRTFLGLLPGKGSLGLKMGSSNIVQKHSDYVSQSWFSKIFTVKPAVRVFHVDWSSTAAFDSTCNILRTWKEREHGTLDIIEKPNIGQVEVKIDRVNIKFKPVTLIVDIPHYPRTNPCGMRKSGNCIVRFIQIAGATSTFGKFVESMVAVLQQRGATVDRVDV